MDAQRPHRTGDVEACEATPLGRLVQPGNHPGEAHYRDTYELLVVLTGSGSLACARRSVTASRGTSVLIAPGLVHSHARMSSTESWSVQFRAGDVDVIMPLVDAHVGHFNDDTERKAVDAILSATLSSRIAPGPVARLQLSAIVAAFLGGPHSVPRACVGIPTVSAALTVIDRDYATLQGPSDVASTVGKSLSYVTDLLREQTGHPVATWLREKRLFAASLLLADRSPSVIDVALAVGYSDAGHFARQFVRRSGIMPSAWRTHVASGSFADGRPQMTKARCSLGYVVSVNTGAVENLVGPKGTTESAIVKRSRRGPVSTVAFGLQGDEQGDHDAHGGPDQALYAYSLEDYAWWEVVLERTLSPGTFGENLTTFGFDPNDALVGERWAVGSALFEVSLAAPDATLLAPNQLYRAVSGTAPALWIARFDTCEIEITLPLTSGRVHRLDPDRREAVFAVLRLLSETAADHYGYRRLVRRLHFTAVVASVLKVRMSANPCLHLPMRSFATPWKSSTGATRS